MVEMAEDQAQAAISEESGVRGKMLESLRKHFGFSEFLDAQADVVEAILTNRDALVVMPTGGGKSLCYQLPALMRDGVTIVVSPLIALMKDQVAALERRNIPATLINSTLSLEEQKSRMRRMAAGEFKLVYVAPERFRGQGFLASLRSVRVSLFAIDEAHCLSQWGHDFRPDYFRLGEVVESLGRPQVAAFTATATPEVRQDILDRLGLRDPAEFVAGFARPNLSLSVRHLGSEAEKHERLRKLVKEHRTGIIYCATRKRVDQVAALLAQWKVRHVAYHAGLSDNDRESAQEAFIRKDADVAVATNAFGMGIDRGDIRFVVHYEIPGSIEAYYQEIGRAGRDGEAAACELFFLPADTRIQEFFLEGANPSLSFIRSVWRFLCSEANDGGEVDWTLREMADRLDGSGGEMAVSAAMSILERCACISRIDVPGSRRRTTRILEKDRSAGDLPVDEGALEQKSARDWSKWRRMTKFAQARKCRQQAILEYFGEVGATTCGICDNCLDPRLSSMRAPTSEEEVIVRKILSGVARMSHRLGDEWQGRFGKAKIIQVLLGSRSRALIDSGLHNLSTHGILKGHDGVYLQALFRELEAAGHLVTFPGRYPVLTLTSTGAEIMRGSNDYVLHWPQSNIPDAPARPSRPAWSNKQEAPDEMDAAEWRLFEQLRECRRNIARDEGNIPAYLVFSDQTLRAFARLRPRTMEAALRIRGVGEVKAHRYFPKLLPILTGET